MLWSQGHITHTCPSPKRGSPSQQGLYYDRKLLHHSLWLSHSSRLNNNAGFLCLPSHLHQNHPVPPFLFLVSPRFAPTLAMHNGSCPPKTGSTLFCSWKRPRNAKLSAPLATEGVQLPSKHSLNLRRVLSHCKQSSPVQSIECQSQRNDFKWNFLDGWLRLYVHSALVNVKTHRVFIATVS